MLEIFYATDLGMVRKLNEDSLLATDKVLLVADGLGGHNAGEVASGLLVDVFRRWSDSGKPSTGKNIKDVLRALVSEANSTIYKMATADDSAFGGMGTTVTAALPVGDKLIVANVGDSRAYRIRRGNIEQLTEDHSYVADMVSRGRLTEQEAKSHPQRSVLTKAIGTEPEIEPDISVIDLRRDDVILLCSDGLYTMVDEREIGRVVNELPLSEAVERLVSAAKEHGGYDNITIVAARVKGLKDALPVVTSPIGKLAAALVGLALVVCAVASAYVYFLAPVNIRLEGNSAVIYRGFPRAELFGLLPMYRKLDVVPGIKTDSIDPDTRYRYIEGVESGSLEEARSVISQELGGN